MAICSYLVHADGDPAALAQRLNDMPGCEAFAATNRRLVVLVTETPDADADEALRARVAAVPGVKALVMTFGEVDPDAAPAAGLPRRRGRRLPLAGPLTADPPPQPESEP